MALNRVKRFAKKWLISENLARVINHYRSEDLQKFWFGDPPVSAPEFERTYFGSIGLKPRVIRRMDDYRSAACVERRVELPIVRGASDTAAQIALSPVKEWEADHTVRLRRGTREMVLRDLPPERWLDVRIDLDGTEVSLIVETDAPIEITMPRPVRDPGQRQQGKELRHIVVCMLDAWTTAIPTGKHPFTGENSLTPNIERFFAQGFRAFRGVSSGQWTLPAVGSLFTGLHVSRHRMYHPRRWQEFDPGRRLLPEYLQAAGFHTQCGSVVSRITPAFGHNRGFDRFLYHFGVPGFSWQTYDPAVWVQEIIGHMEAHYAGRTFSYFQFPDTHPSWQMPPQTRYFHLGRRGSTSFDLEQMMKFKPSSGIDVPDQAHQLYSLRLAEIDRLFGCIFDYVERTFGDEALVVVTADHGMRMPYLSEAHRNDEPFLTDVRMNIPLYMRGFGIPESIYDKLCLPNVDLPLMLLNLAGIQKDTNDFDGMDLITPQGKSRDCVVSEYIYSGVYEIAVRGHGHALFQKYSIDDRKFRILSDMPLYQGLYPLDATSYDREYEATQGRPETLEILQQEARSHIRRAGLTGESA